MKHQLRRPCRIASIVAAFFLGLLASANGQTLVHRYSFFNGTVADSVGTANGTLEGAAHLSGGQLVLSGASGAYLNLPAGVINGYSAVTVETWASFGSPLNAPSFVFGFGNTDSSGAGENYIYCSAQTGTAAITAADPGWKAEQGVNFGNQSGKTLHLVTVFNPPAHTVAVYTNGVLASVNTGVTTTFSSVNDLHSYVGRSLYTSDLYLNADLSEFRIWNGALGPQQIALDAATGPTVIVTNPGALQAIHVATSALQAGLTQQVAVTGDFANVSNVNLYAYGQPTLTSGNTNVVVITASGQALPITPGTATLTAVFDGLTNSASVTVSYATKQFIFDNFGDGFWSFINQGGGGGALTVNNSNASVSLAGNNSTEDFEVLYNLQNSTFRIRQRSSWRCIGPLNGGGSVGTAVATIPAYSGTLAQQWRIVGAGSGYYRVVSASSGLAMQADPVSGNVTLAAPSLSPNQLWQIAYQTHYPKKGTAGYEGSWAEFETGWAYNYDDHTSSSLPPQVVCEPMVWGPYWEPLGDLQSRAPSWRSTPQPDYLMTYNEPDNSGQANMTTATAIANWPSLQNLNVPLVSPAMQNTFDSWAYDFFSQIASNNYRVDYTAVHLYINPSASGLIGDLQSVFNTWGRPVWLTEFSPVDWAGTATWSEDDDFNFLAEFMWQAEDQDWLKRYALFPFSGTPSTNPWDGNGHRGDTFLADGATLTPYGELFATWDADRTVHGRIPYFIHNLATSFRLTETNAGGGLASSSIRARDVHNQWALLPAPTTNHWYIISLADGRRLVDNGALLSLAAFGTKTANAEWTFTGPDSSGYYFIGNPNASRNLNASGNPPAISFSTATSATQNNNTRWRVIKPYQPAPIANPTPPSSLLATPGDGAVNLSWLGSMTRYNVYRSGRSDGPYLLLTSDLAGSAFTDTAVTNGVTSYYVVTGLNILGEESGYSVEAAARPVSLSPPQLSYTATSSGIQFVWGADHLGWELQGQTNPLNAGLGSNWFTISGSGATNQIFVPTVAHQRNRVLPDGLPVA